MNTGSRWFVDIFSVWASARGAEQVYNRSKKSDGLLTCQCCMLVYDRSVSVIFVYVSHLKDLESL